MARLKAAMDRYHIKDARFVFNMDQSGASFTKMTGRSLQKGVGPRHVALIHSSVRTKGNLERVTVMPVVSAAGASYTPVIVFPGKQAHFKRVHGHVQTLHSFLPPCFLYQREVPGVNTDIIYDWAQKFVMETVLLRKNQQYLLLLIDGYGSHVQFKTLQLFRENRIIVIAMPAHTSHVLQPLDVSVFSSYKSFLEREIHYFAMRKKVLDAFDISCAITNAYKASVNSRNIISGFRRTGAWDVACLGPNVEPLKKLFQLCGGGEKENVDVEDLVKSFSRECRSLLRDGDVEVEGTVRINNRTEINLKSDLVLEALKKREENKKGKNCKVRDEEQEYEEPAAGRRRLEKLAPRRSIQRKLLRDTCGAPHSTDSEESRSTLFSLWGP